VSGTDKLVEGYSNLPKATDGRVVVSFAAKPKDFDKLKPMINSLLDQTVKVDQIGIVVPLTNETEVPDYVKNIANIFPAGKDYGDGTSLIPILLKEKECNTIIIALKHDVVYGKDFIEMMVDKADEYPDTVLSDKKRKAILVKPEYYGCEILDSTQDNYDRDWFLNQAKHAKIVDYTENFTRL
tara:strand:- start:469 stop:1017 length:549 start_codon:yes stop_codon:yes gene_type:complete